MDVDSDVSCALGKSSAIGVLIYALAHHTDAPAYVCAPDGMNLSIIIYLFIYLL